MSNSDNIKVTDHEEALRSVERDLDAQHHTLYERITFLATGSVTSTFNHALQWPNPTTLAAVDQSIGLLQSFLADAQRLKEGGRPAAHARLTAVLGDLTAGRATLAQTLGLLKAADRSDIKKLAEHQEEVVKQQKAWNDERLIQGQRHANEVKKLL